MPISKIYFATIALAACAILRADPVAITASVSGSGTVLGTGVVESGSQITLRAAPQVDWKFDHWEGVSADVARNNSLSAIASSTFHPTAIFIPSPGYGRFAGGSVFSWGAVGPAPAGLNDATAISVGAVHAVALRSNGTVAVWGSNNAGQTNMPAGLSNIVAITAGGYHSAVATQNGQVIAWGQNAYGQTNVPTGLSNVVALAGGIFHTLALRSDGAVIAWGLNNYGQTNVPANLKDVMAVAAGQYYSLALKQDGTLVGWGAKYTNGNWQTILVQTNLTNLVAIASSYNYDLAIQADGTVLEWGGINDTINTPIPIGLRARSAAVGFDQGLAIQTNGALISWGNRLSQLPKTIPDALVVDAGADAAAVIQGSGFGVLGAAVPAVFQEEGQSFRLVPAVVGQSYQWLRNGVPIANGASAAFALSAPTVSDSGSYQLAVSNGTDTFLTAPTDVRIVPFGYPRVLVNGIEARALTRVSSQAQISLTTTLTNAQIYYTLDGSIPALVSSNRYTAPFILLQPTNVLIRAIATTGDFSRRATNAPLQVAVLPSFTLTAIATGPGRVEITPKTARYFQGDTVHLEAIPNSNAQFIRWSNQQAGSNPLRDIVMNSDLTVEAIFGEIPHSYLISQARIENGQLKFRITGTTGTTIAIESTADFTAWSNEATITLQAAEGVDKALSTNENLRFLRIREMQ